MSGKKEIRIQNKSTRPDNVVEEEHLVILDCEKTQRELPVFLNGFFIFLKNNVLPGTRLAYLRDIKFFFEYLVDYTDLTGAKDIAKISVEDLKALTAPDINIFLDWCRKYSVETDRNIYVYENGNRTLARKKASLSIMFRQLYRDGVLNENITDAIDPIRVPRAQDREIRALQDDEVMRMLDSVSTGTGLTEHQKAYWKKTKKRDKAILMLFITYGLRLTELQQLNLSSFHLQRGEFIIYRKRDKEVAMPLNNSVEEVLHDYIKNERPKKDELEEEYKDALFLSLQGRRMTKRQIREMVKKYTAIAMKTSEGAGYSPHKLRATAATSLIGRGNSIYDVAALLDHDQVTTTQLYAKHRKNVKRDLVRHMEWEEERR